MCWNLLAASFLERDNNDSQSLPWPPDVTRWKLFVVYWDEGRLSKQCGPHMWVVGMINMAWLRMTKRCETEMSANTHFGLLLRQIKYVRPFLYFLVNFRWFSFRPYIVHSVFPTFFFPFTQIRFFCFNYATYPFFPFIPSYFMPSPFFLLSLTYLIFLLLYLFWLWYFH